MQVFYTPFPFLTVGDLLPGLLQNLYQHDVVADHRELPTQFRHEFVERPLDAVWKRLPAMV
jgi:hypothetical protein